MIVAGQNPAVGSSNSRLHRLAMAKLEWLVVRDLVEVESASFWYEGREIESGELRTEDIATEVFFLPAAAHTEKDGSFTNTQRLLQWHRKAVDPTGDVRSDLWFYYHLGLRIRARLADSTEERDRPVQALNWQYATEGEIEEPSAGDVLREINGVGPDGRALSTFNDLKPDGSTSCGCWIYCGVHAGEHEPGRAPQARPRADVGGAGVGLGVAGQPAHPLQPRLGRPRWASVVGAQELRVVGRGGREVDGLRRPRLPADHGARLRPADEGGKAEWALAGNEPFIMQTDGVGWLFAPSGLKDGPLPAHYEPERVAGAEPALRPAGEPGPAAIQPPRESHQPERGRRDIRTWSRRTA